MMQSRLHKGRFKSNHSKTAIRSFKIYKLLFRHILRSTQHLGKISPDVYTWEPYGINASNLQNISIDIQYITKVILVQAWNLSFVSSTHQGSSIAYLS